MTVDISHTNDVSEIGPLLRVLRSAMAPDLFQKRLERTCARGYKGLIAHQGHRAVGFLGYRITRDVHWGKTFYIDDLVVQPAARSGGIGASLLAAAKAEGIAQNCDHIRLCSGLSRTQAHRFYENNGFAQVSLQFACPLHDGEL
ncbi:MAG: GNAT family N-acetyltransferase [Pseudomonadota bacterium]